MKCAKSQKLRARSHELCIHLDDIMSVYRLANCCTVKRAWCLSTLPHRCTPHCSFIMSEITQMQRVVRGLNYLNRSQQQVLRATPSVLHTPCYSFYLVDIHFYPNRFRASRPRLDFASVDHPISHPPLSSQWPSSLHCQPPRSHLVCTTPCLLVAHAASYQLVADCLLALQS